MLKHCVFVNLKEDVDAEAREAVLSGFGTLVGEIDGMLDYCRGPNLDFEAKSPDYSWGFIVTFRDRTAHLAYEQHPRQPRHVLDGKKLRLALSLRLCGLLPRFSPRALRPQNGNQ